MGAIIGFLKGFEDNFAVALMLWPALSLFLTFPILAYLYHRDGRLRASSAVAAYLLVLYVIGLGCFTLYPLPSGDSGPGITYGIEPQLNPLNFIADINRDGMKAVFQLLFNVVLFMPLGFFARSFLRLGLPVTAALALAVTLLIETAQLTGLFGIYPYAYRTFEVDDLICNTLGGIAGWFCGRAVGRIWPAPEEGVPAITHQPGFVRRCVAWWIDWVLIGVAGWACFMVMVLFGEAVEALGSGLTMQDLLPLADGAFAVGSVVAFAMFEGFVPWVGGGSTPGGRYVRMSCETMHRSGGLRAAFYCVRAAVFALVLVRPYWAVPLLAVFYLITRRMPYDFIPASPK